LRYACLILARNPYRASITHYIIGANVILWGAFIMVVKVDGEIYSRTDTTIGDGAKQLLKND